MALIALMNLLDIAPAVHCLQPTGVVQGGRLQFTKNVSSCRPLAYANQYRIRSRCRQKPCPCIKATTSEAVTSGEETSSMQQWAGPPCFPTDAQAFTSSAAAKIVTVVGSEAKSPFESESWQSVMQHMVRRINWIDPEFQMLVFLDKDLYCNTPSQDVLAAISEADILFAVEVTSPAGVAHVGPLMDQSETSLSLGPSQDLLTRSRLGGIAVGQLSGVQKAVADLGLWKQAADGMKIFQSVLEAWSRKNPDDVWFSILLVVDAYVTDVAMLKNLRAKDFSTLQCMVGNCGPQIWDCLQDATCRNAIGCLTSCAPTDQVCSYRCIVSYESPQFEQFSLCILQKHNCLGLDAEIRTRPVVSAMKSFRGQEMTHSLAEDLLVGWLGKKEYSWRVVAGQNAAYDQFPCQYQIFYKGKARGSVWYDPVFMVKTLGGETVWRRRHYRVRRAEVPGTFLFSVLDNGVISKEFWHIIHVAEDFGWALFYYSGAAAAAGQSYTGAVLLTADGNWPRQEDEAEVEAALEKCGIKVWELYRVNNTSCQNAPLGLPEDAPNPSSIV